MTILKIIVFIYSEYLVYFILMIRGNDMYECVWGVGDWVDGWGVVFVTMYHYVIESID